jgi:hypothetical protein
MINRGAGTPSWVEIENDGGEVELAAYGFRIRNADTSVANIWQGGAEDILGGSLTLRLTDGSEAANPGPLAEPRMVIPLAALDLSGTPGGELILFWMDAEMNIQEETVTVRAGVPSGVPLYRHGNELVAPDTTRYR